jgi:hypothetical protein
MLFDKSDPVSLWIIVLLKLEQEQGNLSKG